MSSLKTRTNNYIIRRFGNKCACCGEGIAPTEIIHKAGDLSYHLDCFHCTVCDKRFETGDQFFLLDDKRLVCKEDYEDAKLRGKLCYFIGSKSMKERSKW